MLDARQHAFVVSGLAGLCAAALGWLLLGSTNLDKRLSQLQDSISRNGTRATPAVDIAAHAALAARSAPLFARPPSVGAPPVARLDGISVRPGGGSALISIGGAPSRWIRQGETSGQLTLVAVSSSSVIIETPDGRSTLRLGETSGAPAVAPSAGGAPAVATMDEVPTGYRQPPPPASAPGA